MKTTWAHPDSCFLRDRREGDAVVWTYRVVVEWTGQREEAEIDVWNPRLEPDRDDSGNLYYEPEFDRLTLGGGDPLGDLEDTYTDAVRELLAAEDWRD